MIAILRGLLVGAAGGALCWAAGVPAPWLAGSMAAAIVAIFAGVKIGMPDWLKATSFIFLGIQIGTTVNWDTVNSAAHWPASLGFLGLTVVAVTWGCAAFYVRVRKWDAATALFASLPGALSLVLLLASDTNADMRRVSIAQCIRLFFLIAALPALILYLSPSGAAVNAAPQIGGLFEIAVLVTVAVASGLVLERLRVPAGLILGPTLAAATLELSGAIHGAAPASLLIPANVILGVMVASQFRDFSLTDFRQALGEGFAGFVIALMIAAAGAAIASWFSGLPYALTLLAYSPGGLEAMTIMAFALNLDPAYVGSHQIARYVGLALTMPWVTHVVLLRMGVNLPVRAIAVEED